VLHKKTCLLLRSDRMRCTATARHRRSTARGQLSRNLTVRYSGGEHEIDRKLFCYGVGTRLIFLYPPLLSHRLKRRRKFPVKRPKVEWCLVDGNLPIIPPVLDEGRNDCIECPHPPFSDDRTRCCPSHLVDLEPDKFVMRLATDKAGVLGHLVENEHHIELRDRDVRIQLRHLLSQLLLVFSRERADRMVNFPQRHLSSLLIGWAFIERECILRHRIF